ncbi:MAG: hypothetical protein HKL96_10365 [Phycisphaerales bacterium]|nr:hypothetical protein [Phycisphaerales bacterium]
MMVIAYHCTFCAYGFWLPNDPRGSWSDCVRSWDMFIAAGGGTACNARRSVAATVLPAAGQAARAAGRAALSHRPTVFTSQQIEAIGRGFGRAVIEADFRIVACAIMPNHVHAVILRHARAIEMIVGHLRSRATKQLGLEGLRPDQPIWARSGWNVFLNGNTQIAGAIAYVNANPPKAGLARQSWEFVQPWNGGVASGV